jgi:hypothetical protein
MAPAGFDLPDAGFQPVSSSAEPGAARRIFVAPADGGSRRALGAVADVACRAPGGAWLAAQAVVVPSPILPTSRATYAPLHRAPTDAAAAHRLARLPYVRPAGLPTPAAARAPPPRASAGSADPAAPARPHRRRA